MEFNHHHEDAVVSAAVYVHEGVTLEVAVGPIVETAARKVGRCGALVKVVCAVGGRR